MPGMKIALGADHAGFELKEKIKACSLIMISEIDDKDMWNKCLDSKGEIKAVEFMRKPASYIPFIESVSLCFS